MRPGPELGLVRQGSLPEGLTRTPPVADVPGEKVRRHAESIMLEHMIMIKQENTIV